MKEKLQDFIKNFGWARIIIAMFLLFLFLIAPVFKVSLVGSITDVINRFGMNAILVLSMVPMVQAGVGLNFGIALGIIGGLFGAVIALEFGLTGFAGFFTAMIIAIILGIIFGYIYAIILNKVKGDEMIISTYIGFAFVYFMNMMYLVLPFKNPGSVQGFKGQGLRTTISLQDNWISILNNILKIDLSKILKIDSTQPYIIPTGMLIFFAIAAYLMYLFFKSKTGTAMTAVGSNSDFARASGININKMRTLAVIISTATAAVGILVYQQSFGFVELYVAPLAFTFPTIAALLLGGATVNKATIPNVIIGTILFQGMLTMTPTVMNAAIQADISEIVRIVVTNGMILYALTRKGK